MNFQEDAGNSGRIDDRESGAMSMLSEYPEREWESNETRLQHRLACLAEAMCAAGIATAFVKLDGFNDNGVVEEIVWVPPAPQSPGLAALEETVRELALPLAEHTCGGWEQDDGNLATIAITAKGAETRIIDRAYGEVWEQSRVAAERQPSLEYEEPDDSLDSPGF